MSETNEFDLPEELVITSIFPRLPVKSLLRFKSISKTFNSIISSSYFAKLQLKNSISSNNSSHLLINHEKCFLSFDFESFGSGNKWDCSPFNNEGDIVSDKSGLARIIDCEFEVPNSDIIAIGSCDGLVCLKTEFDFLYIWNPTTAIECFEIPLLSGHNKEDTVWGFGCFTSDRDYKIVKIDQNTRNNEKSIEIFSLLEDSWTISQEMMDGFGGTPKLSGLGVSLNDATYWLYPATYLCYDVYLKGMRDQLRWWIIGFDLVNQKLRRVPLPDEEVIGGFLVRPIMYVMEDRLCACWELNEKHDIQVATLKEEGGTRSWIKLHQVSHDIVPWWYLSINVHNITTKTRFAIEFFSTRSYGHDLWDPNPPAQNTLFLLDHAQESAGDVHKLRIPDSKNVVTYIESLISPIYKS